jgi:hypothetical protein
MGTSTGLPPKNLALGLAIALKSARLTGVVVEPYPSMVWQARIAASSRRS